MSPSKPPSLSTRVARVGYVDHRYFGYGALTELAGVEDYVGVMSMAVTGRRASPEVRAFLDDVSVIISAADPRIWPLKITRLVAAYGSWTASFVAGQLCIEGDRIGQPTAEFAARQLVELHDAVRGRVDDREELERHATTLVTRTKRLIGYGIAFREADERLTALIPFLERRGATSRPFWKVQEALSAVVRRLRGIPPNIVTGLAAVLLDDGYAPPEIGALCAFLNLNCFAANACEGARQASAVLRQLPDELVEDLGREPRTTGRRK